MITSNNDTWYGISKKDPYNLYNFVNFLASSSCPDSHAVERYFENFGKLSGINIKSPTGECEHPDKDVLPEKYFSPIPPKIETDFKVANIPSVNWTKIFKRIKRFFRRAKVFCIKIITA